MLLYVLNSFPAMMYERLFLPDYDNTAFFDHIQYASENKGEMFTYYTGAMGLWYLEQMFKIHPEIEETLGFNFLDIELTLANKFELDGPEIRFYKKVKQMNFDVNDVATWGANYLHSIFIIIFGESDEKEIALSEYASAKSLDNSLSKIESVFSLSLEYTLKAFNKKSAPPR